MSIINDFKAIKDGLDGLKEKPEPKTVFDNQEYTIMGVKWVLTRNPNDLQWYWIKEGEDITQANPTTHQMTGGLYSHQANAQAQANPDLGVRWGWNPQLDRYVWPRNKEEWDDYYSQPSKEGAKCIRDGWINPDLENALKFYEGNP